MVVIPTEWVFVSSLLSFNPEQKKNCTYSSQQRHHEPLGSEEDDEDLRSEESSNSRRIARERAMDSQTCTDTLEGLIDAKEKRGDNFLKVELLSLFTKVSNGCEPRESLVTHLVFPPIVCFCLEVSSSC